VIQSDAAVSGVRTGAFLERWSRGDSGVRFTDL
jgi:hypothetical protein